MQLLRGRTAISYRLAVSPDSRYVALAGDRTTHLWDLDDTKPKALAIPAGGSNSLQFLSGNRLALGLTHNPAWLLYDPHTGHEMWLQSADWRIGAVPGGDCILESNFGTDLSLWRVRVEGGITTRDRVWSHPHLGIGSVLFTPDTTRFVADRYKDSHAGNILGLYQTADGIHLGDFEPQGYARLVRMHFAPDGVTLWGADGPTIWSWDALAGDEATPRFKHPTGRDILATARHSSGHILATVTGDRSVNFFDPASGSLLKTYEWPVDEIELVAFTPDGTRCVVAGRRGKVLLFDVE